MIEELRKNIDTEIDMLREISHYSIILQTAGPGEKKLVEEALNSLVSGMKIINNSIPNILNEVSPVQKLPNQKPQATNLANIEFHRAESTVNVILQADDKEAFLRELSINENAVRKLRKRRFVDDEKFSEFKGARGYIKLSNKYFLDTATRMINSGSFKPLAIEIKKANLDVLFEAYVAMILFTVLLSVPISILIAIFFLFFNIGLSPPYITMFSGDYLMRLAYIFWIPFVVPVATFAALYYYPSTEKSSIEKRINQELPFAVIHMSAISGSGIEPSEIFKIIGMSREYPFLRREIRKVLNQINLYGYDLVTALTNVSKNTPSTHLSELFSGLSTTINSGGNLGEFFEKRAETLLISYRLEREKYTKMAETFMDIYISVVIAAPMILMLLLVMISITGIDTGFSTNQLTIGIILIISLINIVFLAFLHVRQPSY